jgi:hypothetical protein
MEEKYHPETDGNDLLTPAAITMYRGLIGSANCMLTLGRYDIYFTVNTISKFSMAPRQGLFDAMCGFWVP